MTKLQIIKEITKRVGDPNATVYKGDSWNYFIEALYELYNTLNENEKRLLTTKANVSVGTRMDGTTIYDPSALLINWNELVGINVEGYPATQIDRESYSKMKTNEFYEPKDNEVYWLFDGGRLIMITPYKSSILSVDFMYVKDFQQAYSDSEIADSDEITVNNSLIYRAIPIATNKLMAQVGFSL